MRQVLQHLRSGVTDVVDAPAPELGPGRVLVRTSRTLISAGTERALVEFGRAGWVDKARKQPERLRQVLDKMRTDGLVPTVEAVLARLEEPLPLGYCNVGVVAATGAGVQGLSVGQRVLSNGGHADVVSVPARLTAAVPDGVSDDAAAFGVLSAIALHGMRLAEPTLGERVVVMGVGLLGLITVQLLRANGCRVLAMDVDDARLRLAREFGAETADASAGADPVAAGLAFSDGRGVDAVLVTTATPSSDPVRHAARMCRKRGRIVLVGVSGLELDRADFYEKELTFQVSCSYGPGRHDPVYEEAGLDYPIGYVRWTEQRNFEAVLEMMGDGRLDVTPLVSHRFPVDEATRAYGVILGAEPSLGVLLEYGATETYPESRVWSDTVVLRREPSAREAVHVAVIGAGRHATGVLLPALRAVGVEVVGIASRSGASATLAARRFGAASAASDAGGLIVQPGVDAVVIATRHDSHAQYVCEALRAGKHVFVEKPLALTDDQLDDVEAALAAATAPPLLAVGLNRRFSPLALRARRLLESMPGPHTFVVTVNAGALPPGHWAGDPQVGGGRIIGEVCHFIDLLRFLAASPIIEVTRHTRGASGGATSEADVTVGLAFADGSSGSIHYLTRGHKSFPKERVEAFTGGRVLQLDNFRVLRGWGWPGFSRARLWRQDKGQRACVESFVRAVKAGGPAPVPLGEVLEVARVTIRAAG